MFTSYEAGDFAQSVSYWRAEGTWPAIYLTKAVVLGTLCDDPDESLDSSFSASTWSVNDLFTGERVISAPVYDRCDSRITYDISTLSVYIRNGNEYDASGGNYVAVDDWVTYQIDTETGLGEFTVTPNSSVMYDYANAWVRLDIVAKDPLEGDDKVNSFSFYVGDLVVTECKKSVFEIDTVPETQLVQFNAPDPVVFLMPAPSDSSTEYLSTLKEFRSSNCGAYKYT